MVFGSLFAFEIYSCFFFIIIIIINLYKCSAVMQIHKLRSAQYTTSRKQLRTITSMYRSDNIKVHRLVIFCNFIESSRKPYLKSTRTGYEHQFTSGHSTRTAKLRWNTPLIFGFVGDLAHLANTWAGQHVCLVGGD